MAVGLFPFITNKTERRYITHYWLWLRGWERKLPSRSGLPFNRCLELRLMARENHVRPRRAARILQFPTPKEKS